MKKKKKKNKVSVRPAKTQISLGTRPLWSESSLVAHLFCWFCHVVAHVNKEKGQTQHEKPCSENHKAATQNTNNTKSGIFKCEYKKVNRKVQEEPQAEAAANPQPSTLVKSR